MSEAVTDGIRVGASAFYLPEESSPDERRYVFGYNIVIVNNGDAPAQLISRHWDIIDAVGRGHVVDGPGVVGETPRLEPGQAFKYQSFCPLKTPWGTMEGTFQMQRDDGTEFDVRIARFYLVMPSGKPATKATQKSG
ncbi:MAG: Co2+/Mg2+ efflux protein ApaG [Planctomycetota bacterium]|nr:Co2+/Mg2+ efflux protein ApaG [Planctomycetota bacterium]